MAVVFPLLLLMVMGMLEMSRLGMVSQLVTTAARDGCRKAVLAGATQSIVAARIETVLSGAGIHNYTVTYSPGTWATVKASDTNNYVTINVSVPYNSVTWVPLPRFLSGATVRGSATLSSERQ